MPLIFKKMILGALFLFLLSPMDSLWAAQIGDIYTVKMGEMTITTLNDQVGFEVGTERLVGASEKELQKYFPNGKVNLDINVFLVNMNGKNLLFDSGLGLTNKSPLLTSLAKLNLKPEDIDAVFISHMHLDHIAGLVNEGQAVFPKATIYLSKAEYDFWVDSKKKETAPEEAKMFFALAQEVANLYKDKIQFVKDGTVIEGIKAIPYPGHTMGHTAYLLESEGQKLLMAGDILHVQALQFANPQIAINFDTDTTEAIKSREQAFKDITANNWKLAASHLDFPAIGSLEQGENNYKYTPFK